MALRHERHVRPRGDIMRTVDKLDKIGSEKVRELLINEVGMFTQKADTVLDFHGHLRYQQRGHCRAGALFRHG